MRICENGKYRDATPAEIEAAEKCAEAEGVTETPSDERVQALEKTVATLKKEVAALKKSTKGE